MWPTRATPIRITIVPPTRATARQSTEPSVPAAGSSCPVTMVMLVDECRSVTGMPAYAGTAMAEVMPGTTSNGTPAAASAAASSPPRANTNGSPPFSRTTVSPFRPRSTSRSLMSSWPRRTWPGALPTSMRSAAAGARSSSDSWDRRS
jgi:hypothetical protein